MTGTGNGLRAGPGRPGYWLALAGCLLWMACARADPRPEDDPARQAARDFRSLDREMQVLKREVLELNRDLRLLEEEVRYPAGQQFVVFVSQPEDTPTRLTGVTLSLGGQVLVRHSYSERELDALRDGGAQRLYEGRLEPGNHYLEITFTTMQPGGEGFTASTVAKILKRTGPKFIELQLAAGSGGQGQPAEIRVNAWQAP